MAKAKKKSARLSRKPALALAPAYAAPSDLNIFQDPAIPYPANWTIFDFINLSAIGITKKALENLAEIIGISKKKFAEDILEVSIKTLERKSEKEKLNKKISSHALEIARIMHRATEVFGDKEKAKLWINRDLKILNGKKPIDYFNTLSGLNLVNDILGRIEEGVYS